MARIRDIKPDFFLDEEMALLSNTAQLAFIGLWCHADREGRLEDRPERLRAQIFPYKAGLDMDQVLDELANAAGEFVLRYQVGGRRFIQVRSFGRHQRPHPKEQASVIPPPDAEGVTMVAPLTRRHGVTPMPVLETASREKKRQAAEGLESRADEENLAGTCRSGSALPSGSSLPSGPSEGGASGPRARDPSGSPTEPAAPAGRPWTAQRLLDLFARLRGDLHPNTFPWSAPTGKSREKSDVFLAALLTNDPGALDDIEPTMRLFLQQIRDSQDEKDRDPSWAFSCWIGKFTALREQHHGMSRAAGAPKDKPCEFHEGGRNQGRPERKAFQKATCAECRHLQARASPRPDSEASSIGDLVANVMPGR